MSPQKRCLPVILISLVTVISTTTSFVTNTRIIARKELIHYGNRIKQRQYENDGMNNLPTNDGLALSSLANNLQYDNNSQEDDDEEESNPLKSAGLSFQSASTKSLGMLFYNIGGMDHKEIQALLLQAGTHLVNAGSAWTTDWDMVRDSMYSASQSFYDISNVFGSANIDESLELGTLFEQIGSELEDISNIGGCTSVGPPCSSPNLLSVEECLVAISRILKLNSVAATDEHMMCTLFYEVAGLFGEMAGRYVVDEDGVKSEVSL